MVVEDHEALHRRTLLDPQHVGQIVLVEACQQLVGGDGAAAPTTKRSCVNGGTKRANTRSAVLR
jgi:hypothetical protein